MMNLPVVKRSRFSNVPTPQATDRSKESSSNSSSSGSKSPDSPKKTPPKFNFSNISPVKKLQLAQKFGRERSNSVNSMKLPSLLERRNKESALYVETKDKRTSSASKQSADTSKTNDVASIERQLTEQGYDRRDSILSSDKKNSGANSERRGSLFGLFKKNTGFLTPKQKVKEEVSNPFLLLPPAIREQLIKARENVLNDSSLNSSRRIETQESGGLQSERSFVENAVTIQPRLKKCLYVVYFLGIMLSFKNRVKMIAELRAEEVKEDIEIVERKNIFPILPTTNFSVAWTMLMMGLILLVSIITPFHVSFIDDSNVTFELIENVFNIMFGADIIINFLSAYYDPRIGLITSWKRIILNYLSFWFWVDVSSTIPFDLIILQANQDHNSTAYNKLLRLLRFPRLYKLLKILRLFKIAKLLSTNQNASKFMKKINVNWGIITVIKTFVKIFFLNHLVCCFWFYIVRLQNFLNGKARLNDYNPQTWVYRMQLVDSDPWTQYVTSFYWAFQTLATVGYGDIPPVTDGERIITILWMMVGVGFYALTIEKISTILANLDRRSQILKKKMNAFNQFALRVNLSNYLRQKVQRYFELNHKENVSCWIDPPNMIEELPSSLRWGLLLFSYHQMIKNIKLLQQDGNFTANIVSHLKMLKLNKNEILYREEENSEEIYFISKGGVKLVTEEGEGIFSFVEGTYFGEIEILEGCKRKYFCQSTQPTLLLVCPKKIFLTNIKKFHEIQTTVEKTYSLRIEKIKSKLHIPVPTDPIPQQENEPAPPPKKPKKKLLKANDFFYQVILKAAEKENRTKSIPGGSNLNNESRIHSGSQSNTHQGLAALLSPKTLPEQPQTADRTREPGKMSFMDAIFKYNKRHNIATEPNHTIQSERINLGAEEAKQGQGEENDHTSESNPRTAVIKAPVPKDSPRTLNMRAKLSALAAARTEVTEDETVKHEPKTTLFFFPSLSTQPKEDDTKKENTTENSKRDGANSILIQPLKSPKLDSTGPKSPNLKSPNLNVAANSKSNLNASPRSPGNNTLISPRSPNMNTISPRSPNMNGGLKSPVLNGPKSPVLNPPKSPDMNAPKSPTLHGGPGATEKDLKSPQARPLKIKMNDIVKSGKIIKEAETKAAAPLKSPDAKDGETPTTKPVVPTLPLSKLASHATALKATNAAKADPGPNNAELAKKDPIKFLKNYKGPNEDKNLITSLIESFSKITKVKEDCEKQLRDLELKKNNFADQFSNIGDRQVEIQEKVEALLEKYL